jgi:hypothetical protein
MVNKTTIYNKKEDNDEIDIFINEFLKKNIEQGDIVNKWDFVREYTKNMKLNNIDKIVGKYSNEKIENELIEYYCEIYKSIEFIYEEHINIIENVSDISIKRNLVSLILFNSITYSTFLY